MNIYLAIFIFNSIIGILLGATGIGGFLIPIFLLNVLHFDIAQSYSMSFLAFSVAGILGAYFYWNTNNLDIKTAIIISLGSIPGAFLGVFLNRIVSSDVAEIVLYSFITITSLYSLIEGKLDKKRSRISTQQTADNSNYPTVLLLCIGFSTAAFCTFAGAGGPVLLIPILLLMKFNGKKAIGIALFNSVFVGIPASLGYAIGEGSHLSIYGIVGAIAIILGVRLGTIFVKNVNLAIIKTFLSIVALSASLFLIIKLVV